MKKYIYTLLLLLSAIPSYGNESVITNPLEPKCITLSMGDSIEENLIYDPYHGADVFLYNTNTVNLLLSEDENVTISFSKVIESNKYAYIKVESENDPTICYTAAIYPQISNNPQDVVFSKNLKAGKYAVTLLEGKSISNDGFFRMVEYKYLFTFVTSEYTSIKGPGYICNQSPLGPNPEEVPVQSFYDVSSPELEKYSADKSYVATYSSTDGTSTNGQTQVQYFDDFGHPDETVALRASTTGQDIVSAKTYWGSQEKTVFLPTVSMRSNGGFIHAAEVYQAASSNYQDGKPYTINEYDQSPLNRIVTSYNPGQLWHDNGHGTQYGYLVNDMRVDSLDCKKFSAVCNQDEVIISTSGDYRDNTLSVLHTTNEDGQRVLLFKDIQDKTILSRQIVHTENNNTEYYDTYYVYNSLNQLLAILPPSISHKLSNGIWSSKSYLNELLKESAFLFSYGKGGQPIAKKTPGAEWSYYVYDLDRRLILSQSGEDRKQNKWQFQIPDEFNRTVLQGICTNNINVWSEPLSDVTICASDTDLRPSYATASRNWGYSITGIQLNEPVFYSVNYYDSYACLGVYGLPEYTNPDYTYDNLEGYGECTTANFTGLLTCSVSRVLSDDESENKYTHAVFYYDDMNRVIQSNSSTHLENCVEKAYFKYNYSGSLLKKRLEHQNESNTTTEDYEYTYDAQSRLLKCTHSIDGEYPVTIIDNHYDPLGRLVHNRRNGHSALTESIRYNLRSWVTGVRSDLFEQEIHYTDGYNNSKPLFSGNICAISWNNKDQNNDECYTYEYDDLNRLVAGKYYIGTTPKDHYNTHFAYDKVGNITSLQRNGSVGTNAFGLIDDIIYRYVGNQLVQTEDNSSPYKGYSEVAHAPIEYTYDSDGRMIKDLNKGVEDITYYDIDRPRKIVVEKQDATGNVYFKYSSTGSKLQQKIVLDDHTRPDDSDYSNGVKTKDYVSNQVLVNGAVDKIMFAGGYIERGPIGDWDYYFYVNDYQGNTRCVADERGNVVQRNDYYPFGLPYASNTNSSAQAYKYGGKEYIENLELDLYDFEARMMNPGIGRFTMMDSEAISYVTHSPYASVLNNPVALVDPDGNSVIFSIYGDFLGTTVEGYSGLLYIYSPSMFEPLPYVKFYRDYSGMTEADISGNSDFKPYDSMVEHDLSNDAVSTINTDVARQIDGMEINGNKFDLESIGGKIHVMEKQGTKGAKFASTAKNKSPKNKDKIFAYKAVGYPSTVANIQAAIAHELGHITGGYGAYKLVKGKKVPLNNHHLCYACSMTSPFWKNTTPEYKSTIVDMYEWMWENEVGGDLQQPFLDQYRENHVPFYDY